MTQSGTIDDAKIKSVAAELIDELTCSMYEFNGKTEEDDRTRIAVLGEIRGIMDFANALKGVKRE